ncbi:MAG: hypothetical protein ACRDA5_00930 [Clostridium sp.]
MNLEVFYKEYFQKYEDIINFTKESRDSENICKISQKEIAHKLNISQSLVSKCLIRLERIDKCIVKIKPGIYKINHIDMINFGPYSMFSKYVKAAIKDSNFLDLKTKEKATIINGCDEDVIMCIQYFSYWVSN